MQITLNWDNSVTTGQLPPAGFKTAVQAAANILDAQITDNIAVTINVGWGETGGTSIGSALASGAPTSMYTFNTYSDMGPGMPAGPPPKLSVRVVAQSAGSPPLLMSKLLRLVVPPFTEK